MGLKPGWHRRTGHAVYSITLCQFSVEAQNKRGREEQEGRNILKPDKNEPPSTGITATHNKPHGDFFVASTELLIPDPDPWLYSWNTQPAADHLVSAEKMRSTTSAAEGGAGACT